MKKLTFIASLIIAASIITGCSVETKENNNKFSRKIVDQKTLSNGQVVRFGQADTVSQWGCKQILQQRPNLEKTEFLASFSLSGGIYGKLKDDASAYIVKNNLKTVNYVFIYIPNQTNVDGFNNDLSKHNTVIYYACANPPAVNHNPFS